MNDLYDFEHSLFKVGAYSSLVYVLNNCAVCLLSLYVLVSFLFVPELRSPQYYLIGLQSSIELVSAAVKTFVELEKYRALYYYVCEYPQVNIRTWDLFVLDCIQSTAGLAFDVKFAKFVYYLETVSQWPAYGNAGMSLSAPNLTEHSQTFPKDFNHFDENLDRTLAV
ncbi:uncharacterized protein LOC142340282 [Convolutriloba macropyga]|uniref:uncharacterized protein LOC142340282 n=1 Tax=Convolutriloba macropyga TaxID=536237 RepID=UPI003F525DC9